MTNNAEHLAGTVYTETVVHAPPPQFASDAPYQLAIIDLPDGTRATVRIQPGERVKVGDRVTFVEERNGAAYYQKAQAEA